MRSTAKTLSILIMTTCLLPAAYAVDNDKKIAEVNDQPIMASQFLTYAKVKNPQGDLNDANTRNQLMQAYIGRELFFQEALKQKLDKTELVKLALENQRREVISQAFVAKILTDNPITDAEMRKYYDDQVANFKEAEYKLSHILLKTEEDAKKIISRLDKGENFAELAQSNSIDTNASQGGELGWVHPTKMPAGFGDTVKNIAVGKYSAKPVNTQFGWHIIKVDQSRPLQIPPYEQAVGKLRNFMTEQRISAKISELQKKAKIEFEK